MASAHFGLARVVISEGRREDLVTPFYLKMMSENARENGARLLPTLAKLGRTTTPREVIALLGDQWRTKVMGAWFAVMHDDEEVTNAVLEAVMSSLGSLDAPPLATAAVTLAGAQALPALQQYAAADAANNWGACAFVAAAIEHVGGSCIACLPMEQESAAFTDLLALAARLRERR